MIYHKASGIHKPRGHWTIVREGVSQFTTQPLFSIWGRGSKICPCGLRMAPEMAIGAFGILDKYHEFLLPANQKYSKKTFPGGMHNKYCKKSCNQLKAFFARGESSS